MGGSQAAANDNRPGGGLGNFPSMADSARRIAPADMAIRPLRYDVPLRRRRHFGVSGRGTNTRPSTAGPHANVTETDRPLRQG